MPDGLDRTKLPMADPPFSGSAGRTIGDSTPDWDIIGDAEPPAATPNILLVLKFADGLAGRLAGTGTAAPDHKQ